MATNNDNYISQWSGFQIEKALKGAEEITPDTTTWKNQQFVQSWSSGTTPYTQVIQATWDSNIPPKVLFYIGVGNQADNTTRAYFPYEEKLDGNSLTLTFYSNVSSDIISSTGTVTVILTNCGGDIVHSARHNYCGENNLASETNFCY